MSLAYLTPPRLRAAIAPPMRRAGGRAPAPPGPGGGGGPVEAAVFGLPATYLSRICDILSRVQERETVRNAGLSGLNDKGIYVYDP